MTTTPDQTSISSRIRLHLWGIACAPFAVALVAFAVARLTLLPLVERSSRWEYAAVGVVAVGYAILRGRKLAGRVAAGNVLACEALLATRAPQSAEEARAYGAAARRLARVATSRVAGVVPRLPRPVRRAVEAALREDDLAGQTSPRPATVALLEAVAAAHGPWVDALDLTDLRSKQAPARP
ncbi:hypothetical protein ACFWA9_29150 [Kitasatospora sp. NPDC059973]|uniref:hypothetical protein n=1 Tax=Kitasatospora sp. NPDC059973 TaxID=3347020 RepID=UPI0036AFFF25